MPTYVIQTTTGREQLACRRVSRLLGGRASAYVPSCQIAKKYGGVWHKETRPLFPGYAFVMVPLGNGQQETLGELSNCVRLLGVNGEPMPLSAEEERLYRNLLSVDDVTGDHLMLMSTGIIVGDRVVVLDGPLAGYEDTIVKIDRHKRMAWMNVHILGRNKTVKVSLEVVEKRAS